MERLKLATPPAVGAFECQALSATITLKFVHVMCMFSNEPTMYHAVVLRGGGEGVTTTTSNYIISCIISNTTTTTTKLLNYY